MTDIFQGDPLIIIDENGATLNFQGGQPEMDQGLENHVNISILTKQGWWGNDIEPVAERQIGSLFLEASKKSITRQSLIDRDRAAEADIKGDEFGKITAVSTNPISQQVKTEILLEPVTFEAEKLILTRSGQNWIAQRDKT